MNRVIIVYIIQAEGYFSGTWNTLPYSKWERLGMDRIKELGLDVRTFFNAKPAFIAGVLDAMQVPEFFDQVLRLKLYE